MCQGAVERSGEIGAGATVRTGRRAPTISQWGLIILVLTLSAILGLNELSQL